MTDIHAPALGTTSYAHAISADGAVVVGQYVRSNGNSGSFRWTAGTGMQPIAFLGGFASAAWGVNPDGSVVVGDASFEFGTGPNAYRWTLSGGLQDLGTLGGIGSTARAVSADGSVVVGFSRVDPTGGGAENAFLYTDALGMVNLNTYLPTLGIDLTGWTLTQARGVSADGSAITGYGTFNGQTFSAFLITGIPGPGAAALVGLGGLLAARRRR
jgi:probable HAF family extracellular repeat protein